MRRLPLLGCLLLVPLTGCAGNSHAATKPAAPATRRVVLRPVTASGMPASDFTVARHPSELLSCGSPAEPSEAAVDPGIAHCFPAVEDALACWPASQPRQALCFRDPWQHKLDEIPTDGPLGRVPVVDTPSPLGLELADGSHCSLRSGGVWAPLDGHPELSGSYSCQHDEAVWAAAGKTGIDSSAPAWTVQVAAAAGHGPLRTVDVTAAYFVGTASS